MPITIRDKGGGGGGEEKQSKERDELDAPQVGKNTKDPSRTLPE